MNQPPYLRQYGLFASSLAQGPNIIPDRLRLTPTRQRFPPPDASISTHPEQVASSISFAQRVE